VANSPHNDRIVFIGLRRNGLEADDVTAVFMQLSSDETLDYKLVPLDPPRDRWLRYEDSITRDFRMCKPGAVYAVTLDDGHVQYTKKSQPLGFLSNAHRVAWAMEHSGVEKAYKAAKSFKADGVKNVIKENLTDVRAAYWRLRGSARAQFLAEVVQYIVSSAGDIHG
jgi:hypothetical protein